MKIRVIDNLKEKTEPLSHSIADKVAALIRQNTQDVNQGEYLPADLEKLNDFATPEKIQKELDLMTREISSVVPSSFAEELSLS
jgi:hypothetical protein